MKKLLSVLLCCCTILIQGCFTTITGTGNLISQTQDVSEFTKIHHSDIGFLVVNQTDTEDLTIKTYENIFQYLDVNVSDNILNIALNSGWRNFELVEPILYNVNIVDITGIELAADSICNAETITSDDLGITLHGSGKLTIDSLTANTLNTDITADGVVTVSGSVPSQTIHMSGSGTLDAGNLESNTISITLTSSGTITVWANTTLNVTISGSGTVNYYGNPTVNQSINGSGKVVSLGNK